MNLASTSFLVLVTACLLAVGCTDDATPPIVDAASAPALLATGFDPEGADPLRDRLVKHKNTALEDGTLRVNYVGYERGSERVVMHPALPESGEAMTLCYDVRFPAGFDFGKSGKLHGLGPAKPITGGDAMRPDGWSARITFQAGGGVATYLYRQDKSGRFGTTKKAKGFHFTPNQWHAISLQVSLNSPGENDGSARVYIDGELVVEDKAVAFREVDTAPSKISSLLFSTFHGGSKPDFAPRDSEGNITTVHAHFDNFAVHHGALVRTAPLDH